MASAAIEIKTRDELARMREAGRIVRAVLDALAAAAQPGVTTLELDRLAEEMTLARKARPAFKGYLGYPRSLCASLNEEIVHGIPSARRALADGDLLKLDFGAVFKGWFADAAVTVPVGRASAPARRLTEVTRQCLERGVAQMIAGHRLDDVGDAVQQHAEANGFSVVRDFVGHGIGRALHEPPQVPNYRGAQGGGRRLVAGMVLAVEPMVNAGGPHAEVLDDRWTAVTLDRALSAHFEHTVAVTEEGPQVLTAA